MRGQRGEGKLGCIVVLLLTVALIYVGIRTGPVFLDKVNFEEGMARLASQAGSNNWQSDVITEHVMALAKVHDFQVEREDVAVERPARFQPVPEIKITVNYRRRVDYPGYPYTFNFTCRVSSFVGRL